MMKRPFYRKTTAQQLSCLAEFMGTHPYPPQLFDLAKTEILKGQALFKEDICTQPQPLPSLQRLLRLIGVFDEAA
jgi:hypothetical protein